MSTFFLRNFGCCLLLRVSGFFLLFSLPSTGPFTLLPFNLIFYHPSRHSSGRVDSPSWSWPPHSMYLPRALLLLYGFGVEPAPHLEVPLATLSGLGLWAENCHFCWFVGIFRTANVPSHVLPSKLWFALLYFLLTPFFLPGLVLVFSLGRPRPVHPVPSPFQAVDVF